MPGRPHTLGYCICRTHSTRSWNRPEHWTASETAYLEAWFGRRTDKAIATHLARTVTGIRIKAKRLGLRKRDAGYTGRELARLLGVHDKLAATRWVKFGLLASRRAYRQGQHRVHLFDHDDVERFIEDHGEWVDFWRVPEDSPFRAAVDRNRWYSLPQLHRLTGRSNLDVDLRAGRLFGKRRGEHWMVPESELPKIRRLTPEQIAESVWRHEQTRQHRSYLRKQAAA